MTGSRKGVFNTPKGRTNSKEFGKHIGLDEANKHSKINKNNKVDKSTFKKMTNALKDSNLLKLGLRFFSGVTYKEVANGIHSLINYGINETPSMGNKIVISLGDNKVKYKKIVVK